MFLVLLLSFFVALEVGVVAAGCGAISLLSFVVLEVPSCCRCCDVDVSVPWSVVVLFILLFLLAAVEVVVSEGCEVILIMGCATVKVVVGCTVSSSLTLVVGQLCSKCCTMPSSSASIASSS